MSSCDESRGLTNGNFLQHFKFYYQVMNIHMSSHFWLNSLSYVKLVLCDEMTYFVTCPVFSTADSLREVYCFPALERFGRWAPIWCPNRDLLCIFIFFLHIVEEACTPFQNEWPRSTSNSDLLRCWVKLLVTFLSPSANVAYPSCFLWCQTCLLSIFACWSSDTCY